MFWKKRFVLDPTDINDCRIAAAIRGPDGPSGDYALQGLKELTTQVIRYFIKAAMMKASPDAAKYFWADLPLFQQEAVKKYWKTHDHFRGHVVSAFEALKHKQQHKNREEVEEVIEYSEWLYNVLEGQNAGQGYVRK